MKDKLQDKLVEILSAIQAGANNGSDFVIAQLPDVAQQYIAFGRVWTAIDALFTLTFFAVGLLFFIRYGVKSKMKNDGAYWATPRIFASMGGGFMVFTGFFGVFFSFKAVFLVWFAPKVWLLIQIAEIIHGK